MKKTWRIIVFAYITITYVSYVCLPHVWGQQLAVVSTAEHKIITEINGCIVSRPYVRFEGGYYIEPQYAQELLGYEPDIADSSLEGFVDFKYILDNQKDIFLSAVFEDGNIVFGRIPKEQTNAAIQHLRIDNYLLARFNAIMAGEKAFEHFAKPGIRFIYGEDSQIVGYERYTEKTNDTYSSIAKRGIEALSSGVNGVYGQRFYLSLEVVENTKKFTNDEINQILRQRDNLNKNYIIIFPRISFDELQRDFPYVYSEYARTWSAAGYTTYVPEGSGFLVVTNNSASDAASTVAHEAMHLLGVGCIEGDIGQNYANIFDIMRHGVLKKTNVSNVHIYMILKAFENKQMYQWNNIDEELQKFVLENGLNYSK